MLFRISTSSISSINSGKSYRRVMDSLPSATRAPSRSTPPSFLAWNPMARPINTVSRYPIRVAISISSSKRMAPPSWSAGESSLTRMVRKVIRSSSWRVVRVPLKGLPLKLFRSARLLWALTRVPPTVTKSPNWTVARPPIRKVPVLNEAGLGSIVKPGALMRENRPVTEYRSERKSTCVPRKTALRKVIGVRVVKSSSPTVME